MNTRHSFNVTLNLYGNVTPEDKAFVAGKILAALEYEKDNHGLTQDENEEIEAGSIVSCEPLTQSPATPLNLADTPIFSKHLSKCIDAVTKAAEEANASTSGFIIDEAFCDVGVIETGTVINCIDDFSAYFGKVDSDGYKHAMDVLCEAINKHFK